MTTDGFEVNMGVNFVGHFYLTHLLWRLFKDSSRLRIVNVSSIAHHCVLRYDTETSKKLRKSTWDQFLGYSFSKLLILHFTKILASKI